MSALFSFVETKKNEENQCSKKTKQTKALIPFSQREIVIEERCNFRRRNSHFPLFLRHASLEKGVLALRFFFYRHVRFLILQKGRTTS